MRTSKKALFIVERNLYYKYYGPIIQHLLDEGVEVHLLHHRDSSKLDIKSQKVFYYPFLSQVPGFKGHAPVVASYSSSDDLFTYTQTHQVKNIFSLHSRAYYGSNFNEITWHSLQHGVDNFKETHFDANHFYVYSKDWINEQKFSVNGASIHVVGQYYSTQTAVPRREEVLAKYGLRADKKYFLFAPIPGSNGSEYIFLKGKLRRKLVVKKLIVQELEILKKLKRLADQNGYEILIKSRFKRFLGPVYHELGKVFYDETFYPSTLLELISIADFTLSYFMPSAICTESLMLGKPYYVIDFPKLNPEVIPHVEDYIEGLFLPQGMDSLLHFDDEAWPVALLGGKFQSTLPRDYIEKYLQPSNASSFKVFTDFLD